MSLRRLVTAIVGVNNGYGDGNIVWNGSRCSAFWWQHWFLKTLSFSFYLFGESVAIVTFFGGVYAESLALKSSAILADF